jgi:hypothetical protein
MLIAIECHARGFTPTYVAGFRAFVDLNRCVRKGEHAIRILAPVSIKQRNEHGEETCARTIFIRTVPVFDVSMTHRDVRARHRLDERPALPGPRRADRRRPRRAGCSPVANERG